MHIAAPNAGEIIQGYGLALKKGLTYEELQEMVGIHPTTGEEFTVLSVTKSSGADAAKAGC
jgi:thioredoxin reductase (NADPH)